MKSNTDAGLEDAGLEAWGDAATIRRTPGPPPEAARTQGRFPLELLEGSWLCGRLSLNFWPPEL